MATDLQEVVFAERETAVGSIVAEKWNEWERGNLYQGSLMPPLEGKGRASLEGLSYMALFGRSAQ